MGGLTGFYALTSRQNMAEQMQNLRHMTASLKHRGPDNRGLWLDYETGVGLGYRHLATRQSEQTHLQPAKCPSGRYRLVFTGTLYNAIQLRQRLRQDYTHPWRNDSQSETLLAGFLCWGIQRTLQACMGAFTLAVWDAQTRTLTLAGDRMGEKPLYYGWVGRTFLFGSELKALCAYQPWSPTINREALASQLQLSYIPAPLTIYQNIYKLQPGHYLSISAQHLPGYLPPSQAYWSLHDLLKQASISTETIETDHTISALESLLRETVKQHMQADVPVGTLLCGSVQSSLLAALMQSQTAQTIKTFTVSYQQQAFNGSQQAHLVARYLGTDHSEMLIQPQDALNVIPALPGLYDEPFSDIEQIPTLLLAQLARQQVKVGLSAEGADELFGGHNRYVQSWQLWRCMHPMPTMVRRGLAGTLHHLDAPCWDKAWNCLMHLLPQRLRFQETTKKRHQLSSILYADSPQQAYQQLMSHWQHPEELVIGVQASPPLMHHDLPAHLSFPERMMYLDTMGCLPGNILTNLDRTTMSVGLENRNPYLDQRVVEFAWQLPLTHKIQHGQGKWPLRQLLQQYLPSNLLEHPKQPVSVPMDVWLRTSLREWAEHLLSPTRLRQEGFLDPEPIQKKWQEHLSGKYNWQYELWDILMFQAWNEQRIPAIYALAA